MGNPPVMKRSPAGASIGMRRTGDSFTAGACALVHANVPTAATAAIQAARSIHARLACGVAALVRAYLAPLCISPFPCSASANSAAVEKRSAASFSRPCITAASTCAGTALRCDVMARGCSERRRATTACTLGPVKGGSPTSIS